MDEHLADEYVQTLVDCDNPDDLEDWKAGLVGEVSAIGPAQGEDGRWYLNVVTTYTPEVPNHLRLSSEEASRAVLGVWA